MITCSANNELLDPDSLKINQSLNFPIEPTGEKYIKPSRINIKDCEEFITEPLPENWIKLKHVSGLTMYIHKPSRVATLSRPYALYTTNLRRHKIPLFAIPCLAYRMKRNLSEFIPTDDEKTPPDNELGTLGNISIRGADPSTVDSHLNTNCAPNANEKEDDREEGELSSDDDLDDHKSEFAGPPPKLRKIERVINSSEVSSDVLSPCYRQLDVDSKSEQNIQENIEDPILTNSPSQPRSPPDLSHNNSSGTSKCLKDSFREAKYTVKEGQTLTTEAIRNYCSKLFDIAEDKPYTPCDNNDYRHSNPRRKGNLSHTLNKMTSDRSKLIHLRVPSDEKCPFRRQERIINPTGKSPICILHEYCQSVIRKPPTYHTVVQEDQKLPYRVNVMIDGTSYAAGFGQSKKQARTEAAYKALEILIPDYKEVISLSPRKSGAIKANSDDLEIFKTLPITDPSTYNMTVQLGSLSPYALLTECLNRCCIPESDLHSNMISLGRNRHFFEMSIGNYNLKVPCKNKREGRNLAAQQLLAYLHPDIKYWEGLLELYGPGSKPDRRSDSEAILDAQMNNSNMVKTSLIRLLKTRMNELATLWESNEDAKKKGKFSVSPFNLPTMVFHQDSDTGVYSVSEKEEDQLTQGKNIIKNITIA